MHRRSAPQPPRSDRPRVTILTPYWNGEPNEQHYAVRQVAGALTREAGVSVIHLCDDASADSPGRHGAFEAEEVLVLTGRPLERADLAYAISLSNGRLPAATTRELVTLTPAESDELAAAMARQSPDVLVLGGMFPSPAEGWRSVSPEAGRIALCPLIGPAGRSAVAAHREALGALDAVCALTPLERRLVSGPPESERGPMVEFVPPAFAVDAALASRHLRGLSGVSDYAVMLRGFGVDGGEDVAWEDPATLGEMIPGLAVADIAHAGWQVTGDGWERVLDAPGTRPNLWRVMSHARAVIDLRPGGWLGREVIESLLLGTPVCVFATHAAQDVVAESGGGFVVSSERELRAAFAAFADPDTRTQLAEAGRDWARSRHGDIGEFTARVARALLGNRSDLRAGGR